MFLDILQHPKTAIMVYDVSQYAHYSKITVKNDLYGDDATTCATKAAITKLSRLKLTLVHKFQ